MTSTNPSSQKMERTDSAIMAQTTPAKKDNESTPTTASKLGFSPWEKVSVFTPASETPAPKATPMSFLLKDSTPESAMKAPSPSSGPVGPIGTGSLSSPGRVAEMPVLAEGPPFSSEITGDTRFLRVTGMPEQWAANGFLQESIETTGMINHLKSYRVVPGDAPGSATVYCFFDDLRSVAVAKECFQMILSTAGCSSVSPHAYFAVDLTYPRAMQVSHYDGEIVFTAEWKASLRTFDLYSMYNQVRAFAESFGEVRSFAYLESSGLTPQFRTEYFSLDAADKAAPPHEVKSNVVVSESIVVSIKEYLPDGYSRGPHSSLGDIAYLQSAALAMVPHGDFSNAHGRSARGMTGSHRGSRGNRGGSRGHRNQGRASFDFWTISADSPVHKANGSEHILMQPQTVNLQKIERGIDVRTTIMLRNIPNRTQFEDLKDWLDEVSYGHYDFSYLRIDFSNNCNVGYAFVNFVRPEFIINFVEKRVGKAWGIFNSRKTCEVSYATIQGIDCLLAKFRNSVVMEEYPAFRPKLWYHVDSTDIPDDQLVGDEAPFPGPDNEQKRKRSRDNAGTIGLFPPRHGRGPHYGDNYRDGQYDRGNTFALREERLLEHQRQLQQQERRQVGFHNSHGLQRGGQRGGQRIITYPPRRHGSPQSPEYELFTGDYEEEEYDGFDEFDETNFERARRHFHH